MHKEEFRQLVELALAAINSDVNVSSEVQRVYREIDHNNSSRISFSGKFGIIASALASTIRV